MKRKKQVIKDLQEEIKRLESVNSSYLTRICELNEMIQKFHAEPSELKKRMDSWMFTNPGDPEKHLERAKSFYEWMYGYPPEPTITKEV